MKILMLSRPVTPPWDEASKNLVYNLCLYIEKFQFYIPSVKGSKFGINRKNVHSENVYSNTRFGTLQKTRLFLKLARRKPSVDVYHFLFTTSPLNSFLIRLIGRNFPCKVQSLPHVHHPVLMKQFKPNLFYGDYLIVSSKFSKNFLEEHGLHNVYHIYPGIDLEKFKPGEKNMTLKKAFCAPDDFVILYVGGYGKNEAVENVLCITAQVCKTLKGVKFIFACRVRNRSDKKAEGRFKRRAKEIDIDGKISFFNCYDNMAELINISDVCMYPFKQNTVKTDIPVVLLETLAEEKPVVISDLQPMNEIFRDEVGFKVEVGDDTSFAEKLIELCKNPALRREMGEKGRKVVSEYFNIIKTAKAYEKLYEKIEQTQKVSS